MPPKRLADAIHSVETSKKFCSAIDDVADEWICPITQELPIDPVTAEDGRVYERSAIEAWLGKQRPGGQAAKSPVTNEPMGKLLLEAVQVRNTIKRMVQSGALTGCKADAWKQRLEGEEAVAKMRRRAEGGDGRAAYVLGRNYHTGNDKLGIAKDLAQAVRWYKLGADLGNEGAMNGCGVCYAGGIGVAMNGPRALVYYAQAAALGLEMACYNLALNFANGYLGLDKDEAEARKWYEKMLVYAADEERRKYEVTDRTLKLREVAKEWLRQH